MKTNWLAGFFYWWYQVIEEADKPISLVVMVILPFIAPLLPAIITAHSLTVFMGLETWETWIAVVSFELIGYLGMIAVVGALMRIVKNTDAKKTRGLKLNFNFYLFAYIVYLTTLVVSNAVLEYVNGADITRVIVILCLTVGLSVSAGILNASRIYTRDEKSEEYVIRQERREDNLKRTAIKHGINVFALTQDIVQDVVQDKVPEMQNGAIVGDWRADEGKLSKKDLHWILNAPVKDVMKRYKLKRRTAFNWKQRAEEKLN